MTSKSKSYCDTGANQGSRLIRVVLNQRRQRRPNAPKFHPTYPLFCKILQLCSLGLFSESIDDLVHLLHFCSIAGLSGVAGRDKMLNSGIQRGLVISASRAQSINSLAPHSLGVFCANSELDERLDAASGEQALLRLDIVLDGGANAPGSHLADFVLGMLELLE